MLIKVIFILLIISAISACTDQKENNNRQLPDSSQKSVQISQADENMQRVKELVAKIQIGQTRAEVEKVFTTRDGGLQESTLTRYFEPPDIMIEVPFDTTGGPWSPENKVNADIRVYKSNLHID